MCHPINSMHNSMFNIITILYKVIYGMQGIEKIPSSMCYKC